MKIHIDLLNRQRKIKLSLFRLKGITRKIIKILLQRELVKEIKGAKLITLSVVLMGDRKMKEINQKYRGKNYSTDVLAFSFMEKSSQSDEIYLGEILINPAKAKFQASQYKITFYEELTRLLVHGILHLLGFDHERSTTEARKMRKVEDKILEVLKS